MGRKLAILVTWHPARGGLAVVRSYGALEALEVSKVKRAGSKVNPALELTICLPGLFRLFVGRVYDLACYLSTVIKYGFICRTAFFVT
ncbi:hypothetical protein BC937DRAFT_87061 [Endogone sp. FLAS-F59071]|nr:hypothetical protein BC937DRAFT_87061 [Endogone sp. FLAS-F59071]|eukprot:RUS19711.1 hypothetical protein BC937DRAFT_87061 [Endogone sp. FLAS-F59071]